MALTFDDGPSTLTPQLLDILARQGVHVTFFELSTHSQSYPQTVRRQVAEGHEVGNHTINHLELTKQPRASVSKEIIGAQNAIGALTGHPPSLMRPPYGAYNDTVRQVAAQQGLALIHWTTTPDDWKVRNASVVRDQTVKLASPGAIILLHDTYPETVNAVPGIIEGLKAQGFTFVTVSRLLGTPRPGVVYYSQHESR